MVETMLPVGFPHNPPDNFSYEVENFKRNFLAIWLVHHAQYIYAEGEKVRTIWGFYNTKSKSYHAPINCKKVGDVVNNSTPYTAMQLNLNPLEAAFL